MQNEEFPVDSSSSFNPDTKWGTPLSEAQLKAIGLEPGNKVIGGGVILNIRNYDIDGGTVMAEVQNPDGKKAFINVRVLKKLPE